MRRTIDKPNALKASTAAGIDAGMNEIINFKFCGTSLLRRAGEVVEVSGFNQRSSVRDRGISSDYLFSTLPAPELFVSCINGC